MARGKFGERLKRERELREVSLDELSKATRISNRFLQALENEDWGKLPGGVFGHGFVRSIARYLGLSEEALLGEYDLARAEKLPPTPPKTAEPIPSPPKWVPAAVVLGGAVLLVCVLYSVRYGWRRIDAYRAAKQSAADMAASADVPLELSVSASAATHLRVIADDKSLLDAEVYAGETLHFTAKRQFDVSATNSAAVLLQLNGRPMAPLGSPGTFGRMVYTHKDLRPTNGGDSKP
jgi:transcriptional regulator with XRE-family HTH domain